MLQEALKQQKAFCDAARARDNAVPESPEEARRTPEQYRQPQQSTSHEGADNEVSCYIETTLSVLTLLPQGTISPPVHQIPTRLQFALGGAALCRLRMSRTQGFRGYAQSHSASQMRLRSRRRLQGDKSQASAID